MTSLPITLLTLAVGLWIVIRVIGGAVQPLLADRRAGSADAGRLAPAARRQSADASKTAKRVNMAVIAVAVVLLFVGWGNIAENSAAYGLSAGYGFLDSIAGFDLGFSIIPFSAESTMGRALLVGAANTVLIAALAIPVSLYLGRSIAGAGRPGTLRWRAAAAGSGVVRAVPPLVMLPMIYFAFLHLPGPRESYQLPGHLFLNQRGIFVPFPRPAEAWHGVMLIVLGVSALVMTMRLTGHRPLAPDPQPGFWSSPAAKSLAVAALAAFVVAAAVLVTDPGFWNVPSPGVFTITGGAVVTPEMAALLVALWVYGTLTVAGSLMERYEGRIRPSLAGESVIVLQATTLGLAVGFPELVSVGVTEINMTGQASEIVVLLVLFFVVAGALLRAIVDRLIRPGPVDALRSEEASEPFFGRGIIWSGSYISGALVVAAAAIFALGILAEYALSGLRAWADCQADPSCAETLVEQATRAVFGSASASEIGALAATAGLLFLPFVVLAFSRSAEAQWLPVIAPAVGAALLLLLWPTSPQIFPSDSPIFGLSLNVLLALSSMLIALPVAIYVLATHEFDPRSRLPTLDPWNAIGLVLFFTPALVLLLTTWSMPLALPAGMRLDRRVFILIAMVLVATPVLAAAMLPYFREARLAGRDAGDAAFMSAPGILRALRRLLTLTTLISLTGQIDIVAYLRMLNANPSGNVDPIALMLAAAAVFVTLDGGLALLERQARRTRAETGRHMA